MSKRPRFFSGQPDQGVLDRVAPSLGRRPGWRNPDVTDPERVIITANENANGKFVIGALFRRETRPARPQAANGSFRCSPPPFGNPSGCAAPLT